MKLKIATSQFSVSHDIRLNVNSITKQMEEAQREMCDVIHFPEGSLSGYAGTDFYSFQGYDWKLLKECTENIIRLAKKLNLWVLLGSSHPLTNNNKPHNCVYIINNEGEIVDRYDKLFCAGDDTSLTGDLRHYSSGNHFSIFDVNEIKCAVLICHDYRYPELYRELKKKNVELIFHSYHAGNIAKDRQKQMEQEIGTNYHHLNPEKTFPELTMPASMISYAANNYLWISCCNTSAKESCWPSFFVRPDGVITGKLERNIDSVLLSEIDTDNQFYDSTKFWRERAMNGIFYSGEKISDIRSQSRDKL